MTDQSTLEKDYTSTTRSVYSTPTEEAPLKAPEAAPAPGSFEDAVPTPLPSEDAAKAAALIQRNYRGYRERRQIAGLGTTAAARRWADVSPLKPYSLISALTFVGC